MLKFFTGLDLCFFFIIISFFHILFIFFVRKLEGGEKKMQISGEPISFET